MGEVVELSQITRLDLPVERVAQAADEANLESCVVIGYDKDGDFYFASSIADGPNVLWLLEQARLRLLAVEYEAD